MKYLAICRHTFHKAPPAEDRFATLQACEAYGQVTEPFEERGGWIMTTDDINGYEVYNVDTPEKLWGLARKYPGTTIEWGNEFEIYPLIDNDFYWELLSNYPGYEVEGGLHFELLSTLSPGDFYPQALKSLSAKTEGKVQ